MVSQAAERPDKQFSQIFVQCLLHENKQFLWPQSQISIRLGPCLAISKLQFCVEMEEVKDDGSHQGQKREKNRYLTIAFILIILFVRIGNGLFISISGPTLLYLAANTHSTVGQISSVLTGRAAGFFVGAFVYSAIVYKYRKFKPLLTVGLGITLNGILITITPWVTNLAGLVVTTTITGLMFGYLDSAIQSLYLQIWGEKGSRPYMQSYHFSFSVGALLAPIVAAPFLEMADQQEDADGSCPQTDVSDDVMMTTAMYNTTSTVPYQGLNPVAWTYVISGVWTLVAGLLVIGLVIYRTEQKLLSDRTLEVESRPQEPLLDVIWFFVPLILYYFAIVGLEVVYQSYIYSIALCSQLAFSVTDSSTLNTLFWVGFCIGRGSGIFYANYYKPATMIIFCMVSTTFSMIFLSIFGSYIPLVIWFVTVYFGFAIAAFYSSGVSFASEITNVSSTYIFVFAIGNTLGGMTTPPAAGAIFEQDPFSVVYLVMGLAVASDLFFLWMYFAGKSHKKKLRRSESKGNFAVYENEAVTKF